MDPTSNLFSPLKLGQHTLSSRLVMAPLTRFRAQETTHIPLPFVKEYYVQRASTPGTLLITEGTIITGRGGGWPNAPGIWSQDQISAWREIVQAVHDAGGVIFMQLFASGRAGDPDVLLREGGWTPQGPSAIPIDSDSAVEVVELSEGEIWGYIRNFARAAKNAVQEAGFDGVEIHGANGYLVDQFTQDNANQRVDGWGGSVEKRARFALEVARAVVDAVGREKVGFRVSPWSEFQGMRMKTDDAVIEQFEYLIRGLKGMGLAYLHIVESRISGSTEGNGRESIHPFVRLWGDTSPVLIAGGFDPESARYTVDKEFPDQDVAVVFGRHFLATPDLVYRVRHDIPLNPYDRKLFYAAMQEEGYVDYPFSDEFLAERRLPVCDVVKCTA